MRTLAPRPTRPAHVWLRAVPESVGERPWNAVDGFRKLLQWPTSLPGIHRPGELHPILQTSCESHLPTEGPPEAERASSWASRRLPTSARLPNAAFRTSQCNFTALSMHVNPMSMKRLMSDVRPASRPAGSSCERSVKPGDVISPAG